MNITNQIKKDIEAYNGIKQSPNITSNSINTSSSSFPATYTIFTYGTLKIVVIIILISLIAWYMYNTNISMTEYNTKITSFVDYMKLIWNNMMTFINNIRFNNNSKTGSEPVNTTKDYNVVVARNNIPEIPAKDVIKTALDVNALKYIATVEKSDKSDIPGWCYIGKENSGFGVCVQSNNSNLCESNMYFDTEDKCVNNENTNNK